VRFLVDECTGPGVARWLIAQGHDVFSVFDEARGAKDENLRSQALREARIIITIDKDFGEMVFRDRLPHCGIVLLRLDDQRTVNKVAVLKQLLAYHAEKLPDAFVVASENRVRFAGT
jgi:predicted nuclease of predicted toxin-antitoxin system